MTWRVPTTIALLVLLLCQAGGLSARQSPDGTPTFRAGINFVRVDVIVTDKKGEPAGDLTIEDFEVFEDNRPQKVEQFKLIRVDGNARVGDAPVGEIRSAADEERELARDDVRLFVIFFDDYHTRDISALSVKRSLIQFVQNQLGPRDLVALMYPLTPLDAISFTRNQASIISAINNFAGRKYRYDPRNMFEEKYAHYPTEEVERIRNQVVMTALRGLVTRLGGLREGRKAILFVSEGLGSSLPSQMRFADALSPIPLTTRPDGPFEDTTTFFNQGDLLRQMSDVVDAANRNNAAFYPIDPRGLAVSEFQIDEVASPAADRRILQETMDNLRYLAEETDGRAIVGRNDLVKGLTQMVRDSSAYYMLGYNSSQSPDDGKFHAISVRLSARARSRGLQVRTRKGYLAPTRADVLRATVPAKPSAPTPVLQALATMVQPAAANLFVRSWVGLSRGPGGRTRVTYVWEPVPTVPGVRREAAGQVSVIAATSGGDLLFRGKAPGRGADTGSGGAASAAPHGGSVSFDAPPGPLQLRLSVEGATGGVLDTEQREVLVPDPAARDAAMSTPRVYRARTARDAQALAQDGAAVPTVGREFSRTERLLVRVDVQEGSPTAALLNRAGQKMADIPVVPAAAGGTHQLDLALAPLAAGEYVLELRPPAGEPVLVAFRVGS